MNITYEGENKAYMHLEHAEIHHLAGKGFHILKWMKQNELCRLMCTERVFQQICGEPAINSDRTLFVVRMHIEVMTDFVTYLNEIYANSSSNLHKPVRLYYTVGPVKNSSAECHIRTVDAVTNKTLMKGTTILVAVDRLSRRPASYPIKFKAFVNDHETIYHKWEDGPLKSIPAGVKEFLWQRRLTCFETDLNRHGNNSVYVILPLECLQAAINEGFSTHLLRDMTKNMIHKCEILIVNESNLGDLIMVQMWPSESGYFNFILSVNGKHIAYVNMLFFPCQ